MARQRVTLESWIRDALTDSDKESACNALSLVHRVGNHDKEIHSKKISPGLNPRDLADLFRGKAESYSQDLVGVQTFVLLAFYGKNEPEAFMPFIVQGEVHFNGGVTEAPTPTGEKQQSMRFSEMMVQLAYRQMNAVFETQTRLIAQMGEREERLLRENHESFEIMREMIMNEATNRQAHEMRQLEYARSSAERQKWLGLAAPLVNTLTGKEVFPQGVADSAIVDAVAQHLTPEQIQSIAATLPPEVLALLADRIAAIERRKREKEQIVANLPPGNLSDELDS